MQGLREVTDCGWGVSCVRVQLVPLLFMNTALS